jgi:hypothetical protein
MRVNLTTVAARAAAFTVAAVAGAASFEHIASVAIAAGERPWVGYTLPLAIDGLIVVGVAALLEDKRHGRTGRLSARLAVTVGVLATLAANIASAQPTWTARLVAVAAPVSFLLSIEVLTRSGRPAKHPSPTPARDTAAVTAVGHASNGHAGNGQTGGGHAGHSNGQPGSGQASGGHAGDGHADSGHPANGQVRPASTRTRTSTSAGRTPRRTSAAAGGGSYPWHYLLTQLGMEAVAAARGQERPRREAATTRRRRLTSSRVLDHLLGVNQFFTDLAGHARLHGGQLQRWLSAAQCAQPWALGDVAFLGVKPDGHGVWAENDAVTPFYLEWDSGTEPLPVLTDKIGQYHRQMQHRLPRWPVLISLHSAVRERNLHHRLAATPASTRVVVATSSRDQLTTAQMSPADQVWLVHGGGTTGRLRIADLAHLAADPPPAL